MRILQAYLYQLFHERLYGLFLLGTIAMAASMSSGNLTMPERYLSELYGTGGAMYTLLGCTVILCTFMGKEFYYRGFQNKTACGASRLSLTAGSMGAALLGVLPAIGVFPFASMLFYRIFAGWQSESGLKAWGIMLLPEFPLLLLAWVLGILSVCGVVFFLVFCSRDIGKSIGLSVLFIFLSVMLFRQILQVEYLGFLKPLLEGVPLYKMLMVLNPAAISPEQVAVLGALTGIVLCGTFLCSYLVCRRASLK